MPKPILSDSLFNASDVAEAIVNNVDLGVINTNLALTDISSHFTTQSGWNSYTNHMIHFNGFVFFASYLVHTVGTPSSGEVFMTIDESSYRPASEYRFPATGYEGDNASRVSIQTNGDIKIDDPVNVSSTTYFINLNGWWHTTH